LRDLTINNNGAIPTTLSDRYSLNNWKVNIGSYAFYNCSNLIQIYAPNVTNIGTNSFASCQRLRIFNAPNLMGWGASPFNNSTDLVEINFNADIETYTDGQGHAAFRYKPINYNSLILNTYFDNLSMSQSFCALILNNQEIYNLYLNDLSWMNAKLGNGNWLYSIMKYIS
jgi:hypothetical protein